MNAETVIGFLLEALNKVDQQYYGNHLGDEVFVRQGTDRDHPLREPLEIYFSRFGERFFCYELYHQIRVLMDAHIAEHNLGDEPNRVVFQGELKKNDIGPVVELFRDVAEPLDQEYIPDFLLHSPGSFDRQELVIEVKSAPNTSARSIREDLKKIQQFITRYGYRRGVFLTVNTSIARIDRILNSVIGFRWIQANLPDADKIMVIQKQNRIADTFTRWLDIESRWEPPING